MKLSEFFSVPSRKASARRLPLTVMLLLVFCLAHSTAQAAGSVTNTSDAGQGSLRDALIGGGNVTFAPSVYGTIVLATTLIIKNDTTITGPGAGFIRVDGHNNDSVPAQKSLSVFQIELGTNQVSISGITIARGQASGTDPATGRGVTGSGGGIDNESAGTLTVTNCIFTQNHAYMGGSLFNNGGGAVALTGCTLTGGDSNYYGSGFANPNGTVTLTKCTISGNTGAYGTAFSNSGTVVADGCTITGNSGTNAGSGILTSGTATITRCTIVGNGITNSGSLTLTGSTLTSDAIGANPAALYNSNNAIGAVTLIDDILWGDGSREINSAPTSISASYCDIQQVSGYGSGYPGAAPASPYPGTGNINTDPNFVRNPNLSVTPLDPGDEHLQSGSPCRGTGVAASGNSTDLDGNSRSNPPSIGAYE